MLIRLLDCTACAPRADRKRLWLDLGQTISLGRSLATADHKIIDDCYLPMLVLRNQTWGSIELVLTQHSSFDLRRFAPLILVPRALQMSGDKMPARYFLEFVILNRGARPARQQEV